MKNSLHVCRFRFPQKPVPLGTHVTGWLNACNHKNPECRGNIQRNHEDMAAAATFNNDVSPLVAAAGAIVYITAYAKK